jgi:hypothetical protein
MERLFNLTGRAQVQESANVGLQDRHPQGRGYLINAIIASGRASSGLCGMVA